MESGVAGIVLLSDPPLGLPDCAVDVGGDAGAVETLGSWLSSFWPGGVADGDNTEGLAWD